MRRSAVLLAVYLLFLSFTLFTHSALFVGSQVPAEDQGRVSSRRAALVLASATAEIAWMSEIMVGFRCSHYLSSSEVAGESPLTDQTRRSRQKFSADFRRLVSVASAASGHQPPWKSIVDCV
jgi:hypothetical protein